MSINLEMLLALASKGDDDEFSKFEQLPEAMQAVLKRKMAERDQKNMEDAADSIVALINAKESEIARCVREIRGIREREKQWKEQIAKLELGLAYGLETQNFLPLAAMTGHANPLSPKAIIPVGWEPKSQQKKPRKPTI